MSDLFAPFKPKGIPPKVIYIAFVGPVAFGFSAGVWVGRGTAPWLVLFYIPIVVLACIISYKSIQSHVRLAVSRERLATLRASNDLIRSTRNGYQPPGDWVDEAQDITWPDGQGI